MRAGDAGAGCAAGQGEGASPVAYERVSRDRSAIRTGDWPTGRVVKVYAVPAKVREIAEAGVDLVVTAASVGSVAFVDRKIRGRLDR